jgi:IS5 family transposase
LRSTAARPFGVFIGIDLHVDTAPDATTLLKYRRLLETHNLTKMVFDAINGHLAAK